jgi:uncharacterized protein (TIGR03435 family)
MLASRLSIGVALASCLGSSLVAQPSTLPAFAAASVKRNTSGSEMGSRNLGAGGRMVFVNYGLDKIIAAAYDVEDYQVIGAPTWASDPFDITAIAGTNATLDQLNLMLRRLLAERFRLVAHIETRDMQTYQLSLADPGQPGKGLTKSAGDCGPTGRGSGAGPVKGCAAWIGPGTVGFSGQPIAQLGRALGMMLQQPVIDRTGLSGGWDFDLKFSPEGLPGIPMGPPGSAGPIDQNSPNLFTALREQLGLRLESRRAPATVVVIDSISPPTPD